MYLTGFADEASQDILKQIKATKELGWENIESRNINGKNIHDISDEEFDFVYKSLSENEVKINCFGSAIANWGKKINEPFDSSLEETKRAIPRMLKLGTKLIRVMSFAVLPNTGFDSESQMLKERIKRLKVLKSMFEDNGITMVHENCMNYGGMGANYTLELIENIEGLKLVFDTGNPIFTRDYNSNDENKKQNAWEFYTAVKPYIEYVHIKDGVFDYKENKPIFTFPGEGNGYVKEILTDLIKSGYNGGISIEPHIDVVFHEENQTAIEEVKYKNYIKYGSIINEMIKEII